jgi:hypothetical protein
MGLEATEQLAQIAGIERGATILDARSGLGGRSRYLASTYGCRVIGASYPEVLAVRCPFETKELLIAAAPDNDDHYRGYRAVLVRLPVVAPKELDSLLRRACDFQPVRQKAKR